MLASTNCPASFKEMYRSATESVGGGGEVNKKKNNNNRRPAETALSLVNDVVPNILSYCDARTLSRASCVCRSWNKLANADELWAELCKEVFGVLPYELRPPPDPTRILYVMSHMKLRETLSFGSRRMGGQFTGMHSSIPTVLRVGYSEF